MYRSRWIGVVLGVLIATAASAQTQLQTDEQTLKREPLPTEAKGLWGFFEGQAMKAGDGERLAILVKKLGSDIYRDRVPAEKELVSRGPVALPFLKAALPTAPLETKRRAENCILEIESRMKSEV